MDIYDAFIAHLRTTPLPATGYFERHRILPGHAGGTYMAGNIVLCSFEDHRLAHYYRWLATGSEKDRYAWRLMSGWTSGEARREMASYAGTLGGRKTSQIHKERGTNFYSSATQRRNSLQRSKAEKQAWMEILNRGLTREQRSQAGQIGGRSRAKGQEAAQTGLFDPRRRIQRRANLVRWGIKVQGVRIPFHRLSADFIDYHVDRGTSQEY